MIALNINVPQGDIDTMTAMFARYADHFKQNIPKTVEKTMVKIVVALRASTITQKRYGVSFAIPINTTLPRNQRTSFYGRMSISRTITKIIHRRVKLAIVNHGCRQYVTWIEKHVRQNWLLRFLRNGAA